MDAVAWLILEMELIERGNEYERRCVLRGREVYDCLDKLRMYEMDVVAGNV